MARNIPQIQKEATQLAEANEKANMVAALGGTSGQPPSPEPQAMKATSHIYGLNDVQPGKKADNPYIPPKRFKVVGNPPGGAYKAMYQSQSINIPVGKIYPENAIDLDLLRVQGVQLAEIPEGK